MNSKTITSVLFTAAAASAAFEFSGTVAKGKEIHYGPFTSLDEVIVEMQGTGDADLYVQVGVKPTITGFSCRPYKSGSSEECVVDVDGTNEEVFVMVSGYAPSSDYTVTVFTTEFGGAATLTATGGDAVVVSTDAAALMTGATSATVTASGGAATLTAAGGNAVVVSEDAAALMTGATSATVTASGGAATLTATGGDAVVVSTDAATTVTGATSVFLTAPKVVVSNAVVNPVYAMVTGSGFPGDLVDGVWKALPLDTEVPESNLASISDNFVTLAAGVWRIEVTATLSDGLGHHMAALFDQDGAIIAKSFLTRQASSLSFAPVHFAAHSVSTDGGNKFQVRIIVVGSSSGRTDSEDYFALSSIFDDEEDYPPVVKVEAWKLADI